MKEFIVRRSDTLKNFTDNTYPQGSFYLSALLKKRDVRVNGVKVSRADIVLKEGDRVQYYTTPSQEGKEAFYSVYEDENVLIVDKDSGVNAEAVYAALSLSGGGECYFIHRLDRNTQGLLVFARNLEAESALLAAFRERKIEKMYHAVCTGRLEKDADILTAYLKKNASDATVEIFDKAKTGGEVKIITEYRVLKRENGLNYVEILLHTGKTHQIRAHFAHIGCPILGDMKYGDKEINKKYNLTRQCLIAKRVTFHTDGVLAYLGGRSFTSGFSFTDFAAERQK